jgi:tryptophan 7-halogenase
MPIESILIAGGGVAGWLAAAALARRTRCRIHVIENGGIDDSLGLPQLIEDSRPSTPEFHSALGFDEDVLLRASSGGFSLGRALSGWHAGSAAFHPYGDTGAAMGPVPFHHLVHRLRSTGASVNLANYSLAALCAQSGRFARTGARDSSVMSTLDYGLHLDTAGYCGAMKADALAHGVTTSEGVVADIRQGEGGLVEAVILKSGENMPGDLFLDCTGQAASLINRMPKSAFENWNHWLACDAALASTSKDHMSPLPFVSVEAHPAGWRKTTSIQGTIGALILCSSAEIEKFETVPYRFSQGRQCAPWLGNCLAIGGAAAVIDPVATTQLHLAGKAILRLLELFPHDRSCQVEAAEYNRQTIEELDNARDFAILHYKLNGRIGEPFWDNCRAMKVPDRLDYKIALYRSTGRIALYDEESFESPDWVALFDAMGVRPQAYDVMADGIDSARISSHLTQIRAVMLKAVASMPLYAEYLSRIAR